jgi:hypothetical protein
LTSKTNSQAILSALCGLTCIAWVLQIFGAAIRHFFGNRERS